MRTVAARAVSVALAALLVAGCAGGSAPAAPPAGSAGPTGSAPAATAGAGNGATASEGAGVPGAGSPVDDVLGTVSYTVAADVAASVDYVPGGGPVTLSATDASGATWTLAIPEGAVSRATTFKMSPLASIDAKLPGPVGGGVLLEPEGVLFVIPVTLAVTGGAGILQGDAAGDVRIATPGEEGWGSAVLEHFSPVLSFIPDDAVWLPSVHRMAEEHGRAYVAAQALLKTGIGSVPRVPSIPWECRDDKDWKNVRARIDEFVLAFFKPEGTLIQQLLAGKRMAELVGLKYDTTYATEQKLLERLATKAGMVMDATKGQPDRIMPVLEAVFRTGKSMESLGLNPSALIAKFGAWVEQAIDPVVKAVSQDHDYQQVAVAWEIARMVEQWAGKGMVETMEAKLAPALQFEAKVKLTLKALEPPTERWVIGGTVPLAFAHVGTGRFLLGEALVDYEDYHHDQGLTLEAPSFAVEAAVTNIDWCAGTATFVVDRMGGDQEVRIDKFGNRITFGYAKMAFEAFYDQYAARDADLDRRGIGFPVTLRNGKVTWIDETFDAEITTNTSSFEVTVEHTPKQ